MELSKHYCFTCLLILFTSPVFAQSYYTRYESPNIERNFASERSLAEDLDWRETNLSWGYLPMGKGRSGSISFHNHNSVPTRIISVEHTCSDIDIEYPTQQIMPGQSGEVKVTWRPTHKGNNNCYLTIHSDTRRMFNVIFLNGVGF